MESPASSLRLQLIIGKFRCLEVTKIALGYRAKVALGGSTTMTVDIPYEAADIRTDDILTFYTEIPTKLKDRDDAPPKQPSI